MFKETTEAELEVKNIMLRALQDAKDKIKPTLDAISIEILNINDSIKRLEKELLKK